MAKLEENIKSNVLTKPITYRLYFLAGIIGMSVSGYFLIRGFLNFGAGNDSTAYILGGMTIQIIEAACFIGSVASVHSIEFKRRLRKFGWFLFAISITLVTIAQQASSIRIDKKLSSENENKQLMADQIKENSQVIKGDLHNSKYQSKSIYKASRDTGTKTMAEVKIKSRENLEARQRLIDENNKAIIVSPSEAYIRIQLLINKLSLGYFNPEISMISLVIAILIAFCFEYGGVLMLSYGTSMYVNNKRIFAKQAEKYEDYGLKKSVTKNADISNADKNNENNNVSGNADINSNVSTGADIINKNADILTPDYSGNTVTASDKSKDNQLLNDIVLSLPDRKSQHLETRTVSANADIFDDGSANACNSGQYSKRKRSGKSQQKFNADYKKVKSLVKSGRLKPSQNAIIALVGGRNERAKKMIKRLINDNVIEEYGKNRHRLKAKNKT